MHTEGLKATSRLLKGFSNFSCFVTFSHKPWNIKPIGVGTLRDRSTSLDTRFNLLSPIPAP